MNWIGRESRVIESMWDSHGGLDVLDRGAKGPIVDLITDVVCFPKQKTHSIATESATNAQGVVLVADAHGGADLLTAGPPGIEAQLVVCLKCTCDLGGGSLTAIRESFRFPPGVRVSDPWTEQIPGCVGSAAVQKRRFEFLPGTILGVDGSEYFWDCRQDLGTDCPVPIPAEYEAGTFVIAWPPGAPYAVPVQAACDAHGRLDVLDHVRYLPLLIYPVYSVRLQTLPCEDLDGNRWKLVWRHYRITTPPGSERGALAAKTVACCSCCEEKSSSSSSSKSSSSESQSETSASSSSSSSTCPTSPCDADHVATECCPVGWCNHMPPEPKICVPKVLWCSMEIGTDLPGGPCVVTSFQITWDGSAWVGSVEIHCPTCPDPVRTLSVALRCVGTCPATAWRLEFEGAICPNPTLSTSCCPLEATCNGWSYECCEPNCTPSLVRLTVTE